MGSLVRAQAGERRLSVNDSLFYCMVVYILQSKSSGRFYIGQTENPQVRLQQHNAPDNAHFTKRDQPWVMVAQIECSSRQQAMKLEAFIKKQKSRAFIEKLIASEQVRISLLQRFQ